MAGVDAHEPEMDHDISLQRDYSSQWINDGLDLASVPSSGEVTVDGWSSEDRQSAPAPESPQHSSSAGSRPQLGQQESTSAPRRRPTVFSAIIAKVERRIPPQSKGQLAIIGSLVRSSGIYALASLGTPLVSLILAPFLTHHMSPTDYGILAVMVTAISLAAGVSQLGLGSAFFRAYNFDYTSEVERRRILGTTVALLSVVSLVVVCVCTIFATHIAAVLLGQPNLSYLIALAGAIIFAQNLTVPGFAWFRADDKAGYFALLSLCQLATSFVANIVLVGPLQWGIVGALLATGLSYTSVVVLTIPIIIWRSGLRIRWDIARSMLAFGTPMIATIISFWVLQLSDRYLLGRMASYAETASYAVAYSLGAVLSTIVINPFQLAWPTTMYTVAKRDTAPHTFMLVFRWLGHVLLLAAFGLSIFSTLLLDWLFPKSYDSAAPVIPVVAFSIVFYGAYILFLTGASLRRMTWLPGVFTSIAALVNVGLNLILIPRFGSFGAAASTLVAYFLLAFVAYLVNQRIYPIPFEVGRFLMNAVLGAVIFVGCYQAGHIWGGIWRWPLSIVALLVYGLYLFLSLKGRKSTRVGAMQIASNTPAGGSANL